MSTKRTTAPKRQKKPTQPRKAKEASVCAKGKRATPAVILGASEAPSVPEPVKRPPWRPSEYKPEYCEQVIEWGRQGKSKAWMAASIGVVPNTLDNWGRQYPDFLSALTHAKVLEQQWWEDAGQTNMTVTGFSAAAWSRSMAARFPNDWRESSKHEHTGKDGGPLEHNVTGKVEFCIVDPKDENDTR